MRQNCVLLWGLQGLCTFTVPQMFVIVGELTAFSPSFVKSHILHEPKNEAPRLILRKSMNHIRIYKLFSKRLPNLIKYLIGNCVGLRNTCAQYWNACQYNAYVCLESCETKLNRLAMLKFVHNTLLIEFGTTYFFTLFNFARAKYGRDVLDCTPKLTTQLLLIDTHCVMYPFWLAKLSYWKAPKQPHCSSLCSLYPAAYLWPLRSYVTSETRPRSFGFFPFYVVVFLPALLSLGVLERFAWGGGVLYEVRNKMATTMLQIGRSALVGLGLIVCRTPVK